MKVPAIAPIMSIMSILLQVYMHASDQDWLLAAFLPN
jgi:hypothetical protein